MAANRLLAGLLALATIVLAVGGETLVLMHVAGALGLIMLACGAAAGVAGLDRSRRPAQAPRYFRVTSGASRIH